MEPGGMSQEFYRAALLLIKLYESLTLIQEGSTMKRKMGPIMQEDLSRLRPILVLGQSN